MQNHHDSSIDSTPPVAQGGGAGPVAIEAHEAEEFATAVSGLDIEYVRIGAGVNPCRMTITESDEAQLSVGSMGFPAHSSTWVPDDVSVFALVTAAPNGGRYCGIDLEVGQLFFYAPSTWFVGNETVDLEVSILTIPQASIERVADGVFDTDPSRSASPLDPSESVQQLGALIDAAGRQPDWVLDPRQRQHVVEAAARALTAEPKCVRSGTARRVDSRRVVRKCIGHVEAHQAHQPTVAHLCRATGTSETRLRQAFVDVLGVPPTKYFQQRLLSRFRSELLRADPTTSSVTRIAGSLGITELGRASGRYKNTFGELPSATFRRHRGQRDPR